ncbi:hypothetical protein BCV70DRAFT_95104 [Testicularia cyperi]|uniref:Uncharacterized protein n=1 Tax=Testicularia cyperi TaxID=1882483 RepID=A0A317XQ30_9BASI|nr:hypothetical protein BCV70DRAFT_95104 [Testicularia cyperi]
MAGANGVRGEPQKLLITAQWLRKTAQQLHLSRIAMSMEARSGWYTRSYTRPTTLVVLYCSTVPAKPRTLSQPERTDGRRHFCLAGTHERPMGPQKMKFISLCPPPPGQSVHHRAASLLNRTRSGGASGEYYVLQYYSTITVLQCCALLHARGRYFLTVGRARQRPS